MSELLQFTTNTIPLGASIADMQSTIKGLFVANGWQVHYEEVPGTIGILDVIPPSSETIGDGRFKEICRLTFSATAIQIQGYQFCYANPIGQTRIVVATTSGAPYGAGAISHSLTIDGVTVTGAAGTASSTWNDNHYALWEALRDSTNPTITDWDFYYFRSDPNSVAPEDAIWCVRKTVSATMKSMSATNCTLTNMAYTTPYIPVQTPGQTPPVGFISGASALNPLTITVDLTNGWIYYFACMGRTFYLASQTVAGKYGPIVATWVDHDKALAAKPPSLFASISELFVGLLDSNSPGQTNDNFKMRPTHLYTLSPVNLDNPNTPTADNFSSSNVPLHPFLYAVFAYESSDTINRGYGATYWASASRFGVNGSLSFTTETVAPMAINEGPVIWTGSNTVGILTGSPMGKAFTTVYAAPYCPPYDLPDIFRGLASVPDGVLQVCQMDGISTTTTSDLDATTSYTTVALTNASAFPAGGANFFINGEPWKYTGKSGNTLTGVTRGLYGRTKRKSKAGDKVYLGKWFMKYNYAAIPAGYVSPI